jgi:hypothetical protein
MFIIATIYDMISALVYWGVIIIIVVFLIVIGVKYFAMALRWLRDALGR